MSRAVGAFAGRREDERFIRGAGRFVDDMAPMGTLSAALVRSPFPHARIVSVDVSGATSEPGVRLVLTAADVAQAGLGHLALDLGPFNAPEVGRHAQPVLAGEVVRYVGDPVAFVVADTAELARDAAERVAVDYEDLPAVPDIASAVDGGGIVVTHEEGDAAHTDALFEAAARTVRVEVPVNRVDAAPMETRGCLAEHHDGSFTLHVSTQRVHLIQRSLADDVFRIPRERLRVVAPDTGGGFGQKNGAYPEYVLCLEAARRLGRPVKWVAERSEALASDNHGRDNHFTLEAALDDGGRIRAVRAVRTINLGAYAAPRALVTLRNGLTHLTGVYGVEAAHVTVRCVLTNTAPTCPYRGAGRPENVTACERAMDAIAHAIGDDPVAFRRRNLVRAEEMPWRSPLGTPFAHMDTERLLDAALAAADHAGFPHRREESRVRGRLRGFGVSLFVEDLHGSAEPAPAHIVADGGRLKVIVSTGSAGHSHETTFLDVAAARLGLPPDALDFAEADTALMANGIGTAASWSLTLGGSSVRLAADAAVERARAVAARLLDVEVGDVAFDDGLFRASGTNAVASWREILAAQPDFSVEAAFEGRGETVNAGCHVCEVEVDPDTGGVELVAFVAAADYGRVLNEVVVSGQLHGGIAQGIGQAWMEGIVYDEAGQLVSGSLLDYALPRADDLPALATDVGGGEPEASNPLGVKGMGESGATGAPAAFLNAVMDALAPLGVAEVAAPLTPSRVWRAIAAARGGGLPA